MNSTSITTHSLPRFLTCRSPGQAWLGTAKLLGIGLVLLEFWLRVPLRPLLDCYLDTVVARAATLATFFRTPSF